MNDSDRLQTVVAQFRKSQALFITKGSRIQTFHFKGKNFNDDRFYVYSFNNLSAKFAAIH